ncbi:type I-B CRISPR-associated endonuclease Cas1b [Methanococcus voltae]|uniref:type I-B CRISPR-associated endonuclease Cas1b n=1 Tax=Methanococcus voltae TaxID=2188 RepID=UPI001AE11BB7|nr:type I-B CRISPR-associated endonuclease Cas1b [Methanococcus voltae]MBP2173199.1 CRISPR-associated protein Cas1 [Methanococcus voltae]
MKYNKYLNSEGKVYRKENTVYFIDITGKKTPIPVEKIYAIYCYKEVSFTSSVVILLAKYNIPIHYFGRYGNYVGTFYPKGENYSGKVIVKQSENYLNSEKRNYLAKEFVKGSILNISKNLNRYKLDYDKETYLKMLEKANRITDIMNVEAIMRNEYYGNFDKIFKNFEYEKRTRRPPENEINSLISFGNSLLYSTVISEIFNTHLTPSVSYLHEPVERRYSLALDLADVFKPIFVDRIIFNLINKKIINENHFEKDLNSCLLNDEGRKIFLTAYNERLQRTIKHRKLNRNVSYQRLLRLECYKLEKHIMGIEQYSPFVIWW